MGSRTPDDLTRIAETDLPAEVRPLVAAVNQQMSRTQDLVTQQRQFLDDASHQLRTHLTTLQMQADYARREQDPAQVQVALDALGTEIGRATRSAQQLLALGRSDTVSVEPAEFDLAALLREVAVDLLPLARAKRIDLGIHSPTPEFLAVADRGLMREALGNLVSNAITYTPAEGTITLFAAGDAAGWSLNVEDNGPGLSDEERAALGQRFRRGARPARAASGSGWPLRAPLRSGTGANCDLRRARPARGRRRSSGGLARPPSDGPTPHVHAPTRRHALRALCALLMPFSVRAMAANDPSENAADCVIPAKAGGGFALTCALARDALQAVRTRAPTRSPSATCRAASAP